MMKPRKQRRTAFSPHKPLVLLFAFTLALGALPSLCQAAPAVFDKTATWWMPDLTQVNRPGPAYCAPTAATNALWAFAHGGDPGLIPPGPPDMVRADNTINLLGGMMATDPINGTLVADMVSGLQAYVTANGGAPYAPYTVSLLTAFNTGPGGGLGDGLTLWNAMVDALYNCAQVLPIISFLPPPPSPEGVNALNLDFHEGGPPPRGHVVTMTGFDNTGPAVLFVNDPANNPVDNWAPLPDRWDLILMPGMTAIDIIGAPLPPGASIVGAVTLSAVPIPPAILLLGTGLVGVVGLKKRFWR